ncbi:endolytic transglycosylase MltG [Pantanalinema rosaneae CENA516]|uniref:endolytic transglycosylase MltG n=1 Tax=Pantanalinema rosaneae TaxID=1620701 RepID=UPI003D6DE17C
MAQRPSKWLIFLTVVFAGLGVAAWQSWAWWTTAIAPMSANPNTQPLIVTIPSGTSAQEIGQTLVAQGAIRSVTAWNLWTRWLSRNNEAGGFQAGTYQVSPTQSLPEIAAKIWDGDVMQRSFTIPEGWSIKQMAAYFEQQQFFSANDFLAAVNRFPIREYSWIPTPPAEAMYALEGYLYPDTYQIAAGGAVTPDAIIRQMLDRFQQVAIPLYQQSRKQTSLNFQQWVTLSSIVEKEAVVPTERELIAGVFWNRLQKGMTLGSDPTVEYALGIRQTPDRTLTWTEVKTPSPYNTYVNAGLPPTAIASPGLPSLKATLQPASTDYLYFVARYDGTHVFSRTMAEHLAAQDTIHDQRERQQPN